MGKKQIQDALNLLETSLKVDLPRNLQGQPIELQAMVNRMAQKTITGLKDIGNMSPDDIIKTQTDLNEMHLNIKKYGTDSNK